MADPMIGTRLRVRGWFADETGKLTDPTTVTLTIETAGAPPATVYTYGIDVALKHAGPGAFYLWETPTVAGPRIYRWQGTGLVELAFEQTIVIAPSAIR